MARGVSKQLTAALPKRYSREWLKRMDKRTRLWRAIADRMVELESDAGGAEALSHAKRSIMRRAVFLELITESEELRFCAGEPLDVSCYAQAFNSLLGAYRVLGVERRARPVETLRDVMMQAEGQPESDRGAEAAEQPEAEAEAAP
jgi:hypothetical protein